MQISKSLEIFTFPETYRSVFIKGVMTLLLSVITTFSFRNYNILYTFL